MEFLFFAGKVLTGLTPAWSSLVKKSDYSPIEAQPDITEVGNGWYKFNADVPDEDTYIGVIDVDDKNALALPNSERYIPITASPSGSGFGGSQYIPKSVAAAVDTVPDEGGGNGGVITPTNRTYKINKIIGQSEYDLIWVDQNLTEDFTSKDMGDYFLITTTGVLPSPATFFMWG